MSNSSRKFKRQFQGVEYVERISYREARKRGAKCLMGILAALMLIVALAFVCVPAHAQNTTNTFNVYSFRTSVNPQTVGAMTTAAQAQCSPNATYPCIIIFDPVLSQFPTGNMPSKCAQCTWLDYRTAYTNVVTPLNYGAKCDGVTDDSTALQNTINAAMALTSTAPSTIWIPPGPGCFHLSTLNIQGTNTASQIPTLRIEGAHPKLALADAGSALIYGGSTNEFVIQNSGGPTNPLTVNITFANLRFDTTHAATSFIVGHSVLGPFNIFGNSFNGATVMQNAITLDNSSGIQINIENNVIVGFLAQSLKIAGVGPINIKDNQFFSAPVGIYVDGGNVIIKDNYFELMTDAIEAANDSGAIGQYDIDGNTFNVGQSPPSPGTNTANQRCLLVKSTNNAQPHYSFGSFKNNACRVNTGFTQGVATNAIQFSLASNGFFSTAQWEIENNDFSGFTTSAITSDSAGNGGGAVVITYANNISRAELSFGSFESGSLPQFSGSGIFAQRAFAGTGVNAIGSVKVAGIGVLNAPSMGVIGTGGATSYTYFCVAKDVNGRATVPSGGTTINTGNASLSSTNYNTVTCGWGGVPGAASYDVLKTNTSTLLGNIVPPQIGAAATLKDTGQGTSGYTPQSIDQTAVIIVGSGGAVTSTGAGGTMAATVAAGTATMTTAAITAGNCGATVTVAASGVATTDTIEWAFNAVPAGSNAGLVAWPTSGNVNFAYCPNSAETPAAATINWGVRR